MRLFLAYPFPNRKRPPNSFRKTPRAICCWPWLTATGGCAAGRKTSARSRCGSTCRCAARPATRPRRRTTWTASICTRPRRVTAIWLAARRLNQGKFHWPGIRHGTEVELDTEQLQALVLGIPWQRVGAGGTITVL
ncbi:IS66 family insertion sequence element accessory protein TnpB [Pseudomonas aeruginosa]|uniref:IS66 family insertion sequence element accessory protein TnpB n=1 Tax=Pseudomonas aeruginosa TaxID=287 RepID=UPI003D2FEA88